MVGKHTKVKKNKPLMGNHQKCWIWGRNAVMETLSAGFWKIWEVHLSERLNADEKKAAEKRAEQLSIPVVFASDKDLTQKCRASDHQGMIAKMAPFPYSSATEVTQKQVTAPLFLILDRIQDPYNFGAIIRSAEVLGSDGIFVGTDEQCEVTSLVCRTSAGAVNRISIAQHSDLVQCCRDLKQENISIVGTTMQAPEILSSHNFKQPTAVIVGNEGSGISPTLLNECTHLVRIPQQGKTESLNVAISASILLYEASRQRNFA
ncbi:23S rRNA (guanosine(2251)-2'-O)-methyltransferase RlmB [Gimesia fumaroli]|uniref:23S rRNA (Guanosine-2'-O-)-methyltransferase RlmB n=1 Tax=Gimesia fumaroli TaxID=2527976 RepID=A0A518IDT6_9PLAN|nr:23S rRNA (guanosine(2251)-2'-O)-methyltransferase RlmB [Gimesia fumaroli]QDV51220.1 23S rRNA (guanosine-2'-O-)-methyltransferase RlmB [Gimesia fumaroli]